VVINCSSSSVLRFLADIETDKILQAFGTEQFLPSSYLTRKLGGVIMHLKDV
jgi:hypothetical protein